MNLEIGAAVAADAGEVLTVQRAAFAGEAQAYADPFLPPLVETLAQLEAAIAAGQVLVARLDGRLVGAVRRVLNGTEAEVGRLAVAPDLQGRGIGSRLLAAAEKLPGATTASLFTGHLSTVNLGLYHRRGYREFDRRSVSPGVDLVFLRKPLTLAETLNVPASGLAESATAG